MNPVTSFVRRYPQAIFWVFNWSTWTFAWYMGSVYPSDLWNFFLFIPFLSGAVLTGIADGRSGLRTFFSRMVRWRVGIQWYAVALFLPVILRLAAVGLNVASGAVLPASIQIPSWPDLLAGFLFPAFLFIALGEEPGFRGFALPRLLSGRSALSASLILGAFHAIWHIPLFIFGSDHPLVAVIVIAGAVLNTWLFLHTNGSVLLNMLLHASIHLMTGIFNPLFSGADANTHLVMLAVVFVAMAILLPVLYGRELGRKPEAAIDTIATEQPALVG